MTFANLMSAPESAPNFAFSPPDAPLTDDGFAKRFADLDAERLLLAALLRDSQTLSALNHPLLLSDFFLPEHRCLVAVLQHLRQQEADATPAALAEALRHHSHCDAAALLPSLLDLDPDSAPAAFDRQSHLDSCAQRIRQKARERRLLNWLASAHSRFRDGAPLPTIRREAAEYFNATTATLPFAGQFGALGSVLTAKREVDEEVFPALHRREVAELLADEAQGKTTLLLQLALSLASGDAHSPLLDKAVTPRRVVYVNNDAAASRLLDEIETLLPPLAHQEMAQENVVVLLEGQWAGRQVTLYDEEDWQRLSSWLRAQMPDVVIFDGVAVLEAEKSRPSERRKQAGQVYDKLQQFAKQMNCAVVVAHSSVADGNRRRLGKRLFEAAATLYHFRSDHRYREDYRLWRCVRSQWTMPQPLGLQRTEAGYEIAPEAAGGAKQLPTIDELVEFLEDGWQEKAAIVQQFEGRATLPQVERLIKEAHMYGWIMRQGATEPWQLDKRGKAAIAARQAKEAAEAEAAKNCADTSAETDKKAETGGKGGGGRDEGTNFCADTTSETNFCADTEPKPGARWQSEPPLGSL